MNVLRVDLIHPTQVDGKMMTSVSPMNGKIEVGGGGVTLTTGRETLFFPNANVRVIHGALPPIKK